jgi:hypothetical protein
MTSLSAAPSQHNLPALPPKGVAPTPSSSSSKALPHTGDAQGLEKEAGLAFLSASLVLAALKRKKKNEE